MPGGWDRYVDAGAVCFRDPDNPRALAVEPAVPPTPDPTAFWRARETELRAAGALPGYRKVSIGPLLLGKGGAEWEYAWDDGERGRLHSRRLVVATSATTAYTLSWLARDREWAINQPLLLVAVRAYRADA